MAATDRLQKVLARAGVASRRHAEEMITAGRVRVNGRLVTELGTRVDPQRDRLEVDGRRISLEPAVYYIFHKPRGTVTTLSDPEGRATIAEYLRGISARVFPVGRLDFHTSGALLLTNDGDLAQALLHPRRAVPKTYVAKVRGVPTDLVLDVWRAGMELPAVEGEGPKPTVRTLPADIEVLRHAPSGLDARNENGTTWLKITLREGRNRQIHRMAEASGLFVMRLARIAFAGITTEGIRPGEIRALTDKEVTQLRATYLRPVEQAARNTAAAAPEVEPSPRPRPERRDGPPSRRGVTESQGPSRRGAAAGASRGSGMGSGSGSARRPERGTGKKAPSTDRSSNSGGAAPNRTQRTRRPR